jgi:hypothetical protein
MKLAKMLQLHSETTEVHGLSGNFGDSYLLHFNRIYKNIREKTVDAGYSFSDKADVNYLAFPMGQLEEILIRKEIPYTDNVTALKILNSKASQIEWDHIVDNLKPNYIFHESCHAVARSLRQNRKMNFERMQEKLTALLIEESFANTCEFFAIVDAEDTAHRNFLEINSYFTVFEERKKLMDLISSHGAPDVFKFLLLGYVHSNFLNEGINEIEIKKIAELAGVRSPDKPLKSIAANCFNLNPSFRYTTTELYLLSNNITTSVNEALNFDHLDVIKNNNDLLTLVSELSQVTETKNER